MAGAGSACRRATSLRLRRTFEQTLGQRHGSSQFIYRPLSTKSVSRPYILTGHTNARQSAPKAFQRYVVNSTPFIANRFGSSLSMSTSTSESQDGDTGPMAEYEALIAQGSLKEDAFQRTIIQTLQDLHHRLMTYTPQPIGEKQPEKDSGFFSK
ncbi:hypothetical protein BGZ52_012266, partial [Haplosporangium bisporale]